MQRPWPKEEVLKHQNSCPCRVQNILRNTDYSTDHHISGHFFLMSTFPYLKDLLDHVEFQYFSYDIATGTWEKRCFTGSA